MLILALLIYLGFGAYLYAVQRSILFYPSEHHAADHLQQLWVEHQGERLLVWIANPGKPNALLYFGGNAETVVHNADTLSERLPHHTLYLVNYRGYGGSSGAPSEAALYADALAVHDQVASQHQEISVIGRSLGTGVGVHLAAERPISRLLLVTPYDSVAKVAQSKYPMYPVGLLLKDRFDASARAAEVRAEVLVVIAGQDRMIPPRHSHRLVRAFDPNRISTHVFEESNHFTVTQHTDYGPVIRDFLSPQQAN